MDSVRATPEAKHNIIYILRTSQQHRVQLVLIADQKVNTDNQAK